MNEHNPLTSGMDGADDTPQRDGGITLIAALLAATALLLAAVVMVAVGDATVTVPMWQILLAMFIAGFVAFWLGVGAMALAAMAHYSEGSDGE